MYSQIQTLFFINMINVYEQHITAVTTGCPGGYQQFGDSCYKAYSKPVTWSDAASACASDNAHLADITSQAEQNFVAELIQGAGGSSRRPKDIWFGLAAHEPGGELLWSDGSSLDFAAWEGGSYETGRNEDVDCVRMKTKRDFKWADKRCDDTLRYICEIEGKLLTNNQW